MGCAASRYAFADPSTSIFHVWNVDDHGHHIKSCHIQVTDTDIVLHQKGESPILWPLQSLRRYGFDGELFSFECGRQCTTGPGIYAFKCKNAGSLFNILQESLQVFSDSELGLSSLNGPTEVNGSSIIHNGSEGTLEPGSHIGEQDILFDYGIDSQPSTSTGIKKPQPPRPELTKPTAPEESICSASTPSLVRQKHLRTKSLVPKILPNPPPFYQKLSKYSHHQLPRCCKIGTCISVNKHYTTKQSLSNTTCGSCRTCSLNMCVVRPSATYTGAAYSEERARQADYGNVLDLAGKPRQCVHCCCDFKPSKPMSSCSADDCPLHFNNCVDQVANYARLDNHTKHDRDAMRMKKRMSIHHPVHFPSYAHLYTNIPTPTKKWPLTEHSKTASWRSLPHFQTAMSFTGKLVPKRSISHFYSDTDNCNLGNEKKTAQKDLSLEKPEKGAFNASTSVFASPSAPVVGESPENTFKKSERSNSSPMEIEKKMMMSDSLNGSSDD